MNKLQKDTITIIGCGLAGSFLAILLAKKGYRINIYEKLTQKAILESASKRSYNIVLFGYGIELLKQTGLWQVVKPYLIPLTGTVTHIPHTKPVVAPTDQKHNPYYTISRTRLAALLLTEATKYSYVTAHFGTALLSVDRHTKKIMVQDLQTKHIQQMPVDVLIGADGANSLVRAFIQQGQHTDHQQEYAAWSYKQFTLSVEMVEKLHLEKTCVHAWTQKRAFIIMHPSSDGSLGALLVFPKDRIQRGVLESPQSIRTFFKENFPALIPAISEITASLLDNPEGNFSTIHTAPWYYKDRMALVGDAAHGFYPFFGQGTSAAFGDCLTLVNLLDQYGPDWQTVFSVYQQKRKRHMDTLGELSKEGLSRYARNKRADYPAIYDKLELIGYTLLPGYIQPPVLLPVMNDPDHTDDYVRRHNRQRAIFRFLGIPLLVLLLTKMVAVYERIQKIMYR